MWLFLLCSVCSFFFAFVVVVVVVVFLLFARHCLKAWRWQKKHPLTNEITLMQTRQNTHEKKCFTDLAAQTLYTPNSFVIAKFSRNFVFPFVIFLPISRFYAIQNNDRVTFIRFGLLLCFFSSSYLVGSTERHNLLVVSTEKKTFFLFHSTFLLVDFFTYLDW